MKSGIYKTVIEVFIPAEIAGKDVAAMGFAFKTCDKDYGNNPEVLEDNMKFNGDPWWYFTDRFPTDMDSRFILK